jgi:hypothetical protein
MIVAQSLLVVPLIAAVTRQIVEDAWKDYAPELSLIGISRRQAVALLLADCRFSLSVATLAGLGRAMSEVGAVMIVGGNIDGYTRVMTTAIALETSKGDLALSIALGIVLMSIIVGLNVAAYHALLGGAEVRLMFPLRIAGLRFAPEGRAVLDKLDLELSGEGISVILGPNGAGKTCCCACSPACCRRMAGRSTGARRRSRMAGWRWFSSSRCCCACRCSPMSNSPCARKR